jgi:hypothetical protein
MHFAYYIYGILKRVALATFPETRTLLFALLDIAHISHRCLGPDTVVSQMTICNGSDRVMQENFPASDRCAMASRLLLLFLNRECMLSGMKTCSMQRPTKSAALVTSTPFDYTKQSFRVTATNQSTMQIPCITLWTF